MSGSGYNNEYNDPTLPGYDPGKKASSYNDNTNTMNAVELANKGGAFYRSGKYKEALEWYHKSLAINPNDATVWKEAGDATYKLSRYTDAAQYYVNAVKYYPNAIVLNPNDANTWSNMGNTFYGMYASLNALNPNDANTWAYIVIAIMCLDKSLAINPIHATVLKNKNFLLNELNRHKPPGPDYPPQSPGPDYPPQLGPTSIAVQNIVDNLGMKKIIGNI